MTQMRDGAPSAEDDAPSCPESEATTAYATIHNGDALDELRKIPDASIDAIVTDPPYGLAEHKPERIALALSSWLGGDREHVPDGRGFMGRSWDAFVPPPAIWDECLRVLKPGGHLVAFAGSRTIDLMTMSIRLAGFEIRDGLTWLYASGFPKSLNVNKDARFCTCETGRAVPYSHGDDDVRGVREDVPDVAPDATTSEVADVLAPVQRQSARAGMGDARSEGLRGEDSGESSAIGTARRAQRSLEGRSDDEAAEGQLRRTEVRSVPAGPDGDGALGRLRDGTPARDGAVDRPPADAHGVRESRGSQPATQRSIEPRPLADERGSQAGRGRPVCAGCGKPRVAPGLGTALKPAQEPIVLARKPLAGTVAQTVLAHGTGALNIDGTRVAGAKPDTTRGASVNASSMAGPLGGQGRIIDDGRGRWPSNVLLSHGPDCADACTPGCPVAELDAQSGITKTNGGGVRTASRGYDGGWGTSGVPLSKGDSGGASRFFPVFRYRAKAPSKERPKVDGIAHPTVKPLELMRWLVRLVTPPGGLVLDPFAGSGTTLQAAREEGFASIGIERESTYLPLIAARLGIELPEPVVEVAPVDPILKEIGDALDRAALVAIWKANKAAWSPEYQVAVQARLRAIAVGEAVA